MPKGLRDAGAYAIGYTAQTTAYLLLVTERYPNADPTEMLVAVTDRPPRHPVRVVGDPYDLRRSRLTVFFRILLAIPHLIWVVLWGVVAFLAAIVQWFVTLFSGTPARALHRFISAYIRYRLHVLAFLLLVANPFPGFTGAPGVYPLDLEVEGPQRQNRWKTGFRTLLAIPALLVNSALSGALFTAALLTWFYALVKGSAPWGLRNLSAYALRYDAQANAYLYPRHRCLSAREPARGRRHDRGVTRRHTALLLVAAAVWAVAAWLLWRSSLPALHLPQLDEHALFPSHVLHRAQSYSGGARFIWLAQVVTQLVVLGLFARYGVRWMRESAAGPIGTGMLLGMIGFALVWAAELPFSVLDVWWRHHYGLSGSYVQATIGNWFALGAQFVLLCAALLIVMGLARRRWIGDRWWLPAAPVFVGLRILLAFVAPWLLGGSAFHKPYVAHLERIEHVHVPVRVLSGFSEPNAFATGLGASRRVFLWRPIIEPPFTPRMDRFVLAHELGHLAHNHIWKSIGWYTLFALPLAFLSRVRREDAAGWVWPRRSRSRSSSTSSSS